MQRSKTQRTVFAWIIAVILLTVLAVDSPPVEASGWGWAKPLNQRQGLLYTTNKAFKTNTSSRTRQSTSRFRTRTRSRTPVNRQADPSAFFFPGRTGLIPFDGVGGNRLGF